MKIVEKGNFLYIKNNKLKVVLCRVGASIYDVVFKNHQMTINVFSKKNYERDNRCYYGKTLGRIAGRVENCNLLFQGKLYKVDKNDGKNSLHGGFKGVSSTLFDRTIEEKDSSVVVTFFAKSFDEDNGYPGNVDIQVIYTISEDSILIEFKTTSDIDTPMNLTNHCYYNLGNLKDIKGHYLEGSLKGFYKARNDTTVDISKVEIMPVKPIENTYNVGDLLDSAYFQSFFQKGIDHCFIFDKSKELKLYTKKYMLDIETDYPCFQMYSENFPSGKLYHGFKKDIKYYGLAIEPQEVPCMFDEMVSKKNETKSRYIKLKFSRR